MKFKIKKFTEFTFHRKYEYEGFFIKKNNRSEFIHQGICQTWDLEEKKFLPKRRFILETWGSNRLNGFFIKFIYK